MWSSTCKVRAQAPQWMPLSLVCLCGGQARWPRTDTPECERLHIPNWSRAGVNWTLVWTRHWCEPDTRLGSPPAWSLTRQGSGPLMKATICAHGLTCHHTGCALLTFSLSAPLVACMGEQSPPEPLPLHSHLQPHPHRQIGLQTRYISDIFHVDSESISSLHVLLLQLIFFFPFIGCAGSLWLCGLLSGCGTRASHCDGFSYCRAWALGAQASVLGAPRLWSTGSGAVAHRHSCSKAGGIFLDQGLNCWQADSLPLSHQGSPYFTSWTIGTVPPSSFFGKPVPCWQFPCSSPKTPASPASISLVKPSRVFLFLVKLGASFHPLMAAKMHGLIHRAWPFPCPGVPAQLLFADSPGCSLCWSPRNCRVWHAWPLLTRCQHAPLPTATTRTSPDTPNIPGAPPRPRNPCSPI